MAGFQQSEWSNNSGVIVPWVNALGELDSYVAYRKLNATKKY